MVAPGKAGRPRKIERTCFKCRHAVAPKDGDWHHSAAAEGQQVFLCHECGEGSSRYVKARVWN